MKPTRDAGPQCVLFDLDGTLADTAPDLGGAANELLAELGHPPLPLDQYRPQASKGARGMLAVALGLKKQDADFEHYRTRYLALYETRDNRDTDLFPDIAELLRQFDRHHLRWGIVTNKPMYLTRPLVDNLGLARRAGCVIGGDSAPRPKPAPDSLLLACQTLGLLPEACLYVGDDPRDIQAGHAAGMKAVAAGWGYVAPDTDIHRWGADQVLQRPSDLARLLETIDVR